MRRYFLLLSVLAAFAMVGAANADIKAQDVETPGIDTGPNCDLAGYKSETQNFAPAFAIPDNGRVIVLAGTLPTVADGSVITDVILSVTMNHTWIGDLVLRLEYVN